MNKSRYIYIITINNKIKKSLYLPKPKHFGLIAISSIATSPF